MTLYCTYGTAEMHRLGKASPASYNYLLLDLTFPRGDVIAVLLSANHPQQDVRGLLASCRVDPREPGICWRSLWPGRHVAQQAAKANRGEREGGGFGGPFENILVAASPTRPTGQDERGGAPVGASPPPLAAFFQSSPVTAHPLLTERALSSRPPREPRPPWRFSLPRWWSASSVVRRARHVISAHP